MNPNPAHLPRFLALVALHSALSVRARTQRRARGLPEEAGLASQSRPTQLDVEAEADDKDMAAWKLAAPAASRASVEAIAGRW